MIRDEVREIGSMGELEGENTERVSQVGKLNLLTYTYKTGSVMVE